MPTKIVYITTEDNPYDPYTQWDEWYWYDLSKGYNTCERLDRVTKISDDLPDVVNVNEIEYGIDELCKSIAISKQGDLTKYKKVVVEPEKDTK
jgi:hypothetical protein